MYIVSSGYITLRNFVKWYKKLKCVVNNIICARKQDNEKVKVVCYTGLIAISYSNTPFELKC